MKNILRTTLVLIVICTPLLVVQPVGADAVLDQLCKDVTLGENVPAICLEDQATRGESAQDNQVLSLLFNVVQALLFVLGIISVIAVIYGGLTFITSGGDPSKTKQAREIIIYAMVGVVIAVSAQLILYFVLDRLNL